jgi:hypothetical protein
MRTAAIAFLALAGCSAQADEPSIGGFEKLRIESYAQGCLIKFNTDQCLEACKAAFPDDGSDGNQERWLICSAAVTKPTEDKR